MKYLAVRISFFLYVSSLAVLFQMPKKRPDYRENRSHEEFLTTMKSLFPTQMSFNLALQGELSKIYQLEVIDTSDVDKYVRDILGNKEISSLSRTIPEVIVSNP